MMSQLTIDAKSFGIYMVAGVSGYLLLQLTQRYVRFWTSPLLKIPGPKRKSFFFGYFFDIAREPFMGPHKQWIKKFKTESGLVPPLISYSSLFGAWSVLVMDVNLVQKILMAPAAKSPVRFPKKYSFLKHIAGSGVAVLDGETWSRHRRVIQPCFQYRYLRESLTEAIPPLLEKFLAAWEKGSGRVIEASTHMSALTLDVLGVVGFAHNFRGVDTVEEWGQKEDVDDDDLDDIADPLIRALKASFKITGLRVFLAIIGAAEWLSMFDRKTRHSRQMLTDAAGAILQKARDNNNGNGEIANGPKSLLEQMLSAQTMDGQNERNHLSEAELSDEITSFIVAGHDTTSTWCHWALYALGLYPDIQEKVFQDIQKHKRRTDDGGVLSLDEIEDMEYFCAFLQEVLRFYSPVGMIFRHTERTEHWDGYTLPRNTRLVIPIHLLHRHPDHWMEPDEFKPERWLNDAGPTSHKFAFVPFSEGPRNCIGYRFATIEAKLIIANIANRFRIKLDKSTAEQGISFTIFIAMKSKLPVKIRVVKRN